jgi:hypothetical protein
LRAALLLAGQDRYDLHHDGKGRGKLRAHDLRSGFITLALARGESEAWITRRTGHGSSDQLRTYDRQKGEAEELGFTNYEPMDLAIPELSEVADGPVMAQSIAHPVGFEPTTLGFEVRCSIQLS